MFDNGIPTKYKRTSQPPLQPTLLPLKTLMVRDTQDGVEVEFQPSAHEINVHLFLEPKPPKADDLQDQWRITRAVLTYPPINRSPRDRHPTTIVMERDADTPAGEYLDHLPDAAWSAFIGAIHTTATRTTIDILPESRKFLEEVRTGEVIPVRMHTPTERALGADVPISSDAPVPAGGRTACFPPLA